MQDFPVSPPETPESHGKGLDVRAGDSHLACRTSLKFARPGRSPVRATLPFPWRNWDRFLAQVYPG